MNLAFAPLFFAFLAATGPSQDLAITRIWLTHTANTPETLTINWETPVPGPSRVDYGSPDAHESTVESPAPVTLHHVTIPFPETGPLHYRVRTGDAQSSVHAVKCYGDEALRIAVASNWQDGPPLNALLADDPHLLVSCGDLVRGLMRFDAPRDTAYTEPFSRLIDQYPALFATTPFMPIPGNHDRQLFPRLLAPPASPIYDLDATGFRTFFPLPEPGWNWHFDLPAFGLRLLALDLSHTPDAGTTWQSCQPFGVDSAQFAWYRERISASPQPMVLTLYNEWHHLVNTLADGAWMPLIQQGSAAISGFGHFAERADYSGLPCFNTALKAGEVFGNGANTRFHRSVQSYLLLTIPRGGGPMQATLKDLHGAALDTSTWPARRP